MQKSTDMWFRYLKDDRMLIEGLRDIGLPEYVIDWIEEAMPDAPEKSKVLMGNLWKNDREYGRTLTELQFTLVNTLINDYNDYVIGDGPKDDEGRPGDVDARTVEPYDPSAIRTKPRQAYDDERIEQGKRVKFVIQNVKNGVAKPFGTWRKMIMKAVKALSKTGVPSEKVETTKEDLNNMLQSRYRHWWNSYDSIAAFLNDDPTNYELTKDAVQRSTGKVDAEELLTIAQTYFENKEDPDDVMHTFDDGSYWYNLQTSNCAVEGERMGHCGTDNRGLLVSLRKKKSKNRRESSSYVTMTWGDNILYQIKGRQNDAPPEEVWDHIAWFINSYDIESVEETGEHSNDYDGFEMMNEYLASKTSASFSGNIEEIMEAVQENVEGIDERFYDQRHENENSSIGCTVESGEDFGGDPRSIYLYMSADINFQINLGWPGFETRDGMYRPTTGPDSTEPLELEDIPINTWGSEASDFEGEIGLDDIGYELPGEDAEVEWTVTMMKAFDPNWELGEPEPPETAHLEITIRTNTTEASDLDDPGDAAAYDSWADEMLEIDANFNQLAEKIRRALVMEQYIAKSAYDRAEADLAEMKFKNFKVYQDDTGVEFWFTPTEEAADANLIMSDVKIPNLLKQYLNDFEGHPLNRPPVETLYKKMFGGGNHRRIETEQMNTRMAGHIQTAYRKQSETVGGRQLSLALGSNYRAPSPRLVLAKDSRFIILPQISRSQQYRQRYPDMGIAWKYTIGVSSQSPEGEIEVVRDIVDFLDKNPELIMTAANETIEYSLEPLVEQAERTRSKVLSNQEFVKAREIIKSIHSANADTGNTDAERIMLIVSWFDAVYDKMSEVQRFVMWKHYLQPLVERRFRYYGPEADIELDDEANIGKPRNFDDYVFQQVRKLGAATEAQARSATELQGTVGEPRPAQENVEHQIARIENLLNEADPTYDLRIYNVQIGCTVSRDIGGSESETATEIRGIPGVTTVRPVAAKKRNVTPTAEYVLYDIKFELIGAKSRVEYRDEILLPAMRRIKGIKLLTVSSMHRTNRQGTIRTVRESRVLEEYGGMVSNFGGVAGALGAQTRSNLTKQRPTPRPALQRMVDDWADGGVMAYDAPTDSRDMRYHTMMPVSELLPYTSNYYRGDKRDFDGRYKQFIRTGADNPVYLAIGQNGRIKITGGEDLVWFAKKSGLKELPVFLSFQKQV